MAHLWFRDEEDIWAAVPLVGRAVDISAYPPRALADGFRLGEDAQAAVIPGGAGDAVFWALLVAGDRDVRVNGFAPVAGVRLLRDRDEIRAAPSRTLYFSTETLARVVEFVAGERTLFCGRCRQPMKTGQLAVCCPECSIWYHQSDEFPCWTYTPACAICGHSTALNSQFSWTPEA